MSVDIVAFHSGELMIKAKRQLFKIGWKQSVNRRLDCIEKQFDGIIVKTIWAGNQLLLNPHKIGFDENSMKAYVPRDDPVIERAKFEIQPILDRIVAHNKKKWTKELEEYEKSHSIKMPRSERYGI